MIRLEFKTAFEVSEAGALSGLASVFGTVDMGGDIVRKGAFAGAMPPLPMLASHDQADVVGVWDELRETDAGLEVKGRLLVADVVRAGEVRALIQAGAMGGLSIGFRATKSAPRVGGGRDLIKVDLLEISVVAVPMHPGARITSVKALEAGKDAMTPEEIAAAAEAEAARLALETKAANDAVAAAVAAAVAPYVQRISALEVKAGRPGTGSVTPEVSLERKAFTAYLQHGNQISDAERKALRLSNDPSGGYLAPPEMSTEFIKDIVEISPIRKWCSVRGTSAPSVIYPTRKPMGNATWDDESDAELETTTTDIFGQLEVLTKSMSTFVPISNMLLQDAPMAEAEVNVALVEDFEKKETTAFCVGNGFSQPEGFLTNTQIGVSNNGHATIIQPDALITYYYSIPPSYRNKGVFVMNGTTIGKLRTIKDSTGQYLWQRALTEGAPETILGRPVVEVVDMPDASGGLTPIIYGDFSGYRILDRLALSMFVDPYSMARQKQTLIHAGRRVGGKVLQAIKFKKYAMV
jgi:HK97 family phage major capsid protein/HK97 family phage prohead protease